MKNILSLIALVICFTILHSCTKEASINNSTTTGKAGSLARFVVVNNYLYAIENSTLSVFDITNAAAPKFLNKANVGQNIETIYPFKDKLFIASNNGMYMYSLADPTKPTREAFVNHITGCDPVVANDSFAYLTIHGGTACRNSNVNELQVYSLANGIENISTTSIIPMKNPLGLGIHNNYLFVCDRGNGLVLMDISTGGSPQIIKTISDEEYLDVIPFDDILICMTTNGLVYYDISDPLNMQKIATIK